MTLITPRRMRKHPAQVAREKEEAVLEQARRDAEERAEWLRLRREADERRVIHLQK